MADQKSIRTIAKFLSCCAEGAPTSREDFKLMANLCWLNVPVKKRMTKEEIEEIKSRPWEVSRRDKTDQCKVCGQTEEATVHKVERYRRVPGGYGHPFVAATSGKKEGDSHELGTYQNAVTGESASDQHAMPDPNCPQCNGTGMCDSGGFTPWDAPIEVRCGCTYPRPATPVQDSAPAMTVEVGNVLDHWDGMANDTKDLLHETETGFFNAIEKLRLARIKELEGK